MIAVLDYGIGNLRSAQKALEHLGANARLVTTVGDARGATGIVLPGVGNFGACALALRESGLDALCHEAIEKKIPFLGICVGFQLLFDASTESPGIAGLGLVAGEVRRLSGEVKLPQMQWNVLELHGASALLEGLGAEPWCYFVHSYAPVPDDRGAAGVVATCSYGDEVVIAIERGSLFGTQFHPEKSGPTGLRVLENFVGVVARHEASGGAAIGASAAVRRAG